MHRIAICSSPNIKNVPKFPEARYCGRNLCSNQNISIFAQESSHDKRSTLVLNIEFLFLSKTIQVRFCALPEP